MKTLFILSVLTGFAALVATLLGDFSPGNRWLRKALVLLTAISALAGPIAISLYAVDIPYTDLWGELLLYNKPYIGKDMVLSTGGHVVVVARFLWHLIGNLTGWNTLIFLFMQWGFLTLAGLLCAWLFRRDLNDSKATSLTTCLAIIALGVSPSNAMFYADNRLLPHSMSLFLFLVAVVLYLRPEHWIRNILAPVLCACALFNTAWGIATWAAFTPAVLFRSYSRRTIMDRFAWVTWGAVGIITLLIFRSLFQSGYGEGRFLTPHSLALGLWDYLALLTAFLYPWPALLDPERYYRYLAIPGAALLTAHLWVSVLAWRRVGLYRWLAHPVGITAIYSIASGLMATVGRAEYYPWAGAGMRYTPSAIGFYATLIYQLSLLDLRVPVRSVLAIVFVGLGFNWTFLLQTANQFNQASGKAAVCLRSATPFSDYGCYSGVFADLGLPQVQERFRGYVQFMRSHELSAFRQPRR